MKSVKSLGRNIDRGHKTERQFRCRQIVVDGFRNPDHRESAFMELLGDSKRTFSAENNKRLQFKFLKISKCFFDRKFGKKRFPIDHFYKAAFVSGAQNGPSAGQYSAYSFRRQFLRMRFTEDTFEAVLDPRAFHPVFTDRSSYDGANDRIEARGVST